MKRPPQLYLPYDLDFFGQFNERLHKTKHDLVKPISRPSKQPAAEEGKHNEKNAIREKKNEVDMKSAAKQILSTDLDETEAETSSGSPKLEPKLDVFVPSQKTSFI